MTKLDSDEMVSHGRGMDTEGLTPLDMDWWHREVPIDKTDGFSVAAVHFLVPYDPGWTAGLMNGAMLAKIEGPWVRLWTTEIRELSIPIHRIGAIEWL